MGSIFIYLGKTFKLNAKREQNITIWGNTMGPFFFKRAEHVGNEVI